MVATTGESESLRVDVEREDDYSDKEKLDYESTLLGIYVSGHPLDKYQDIIEQLSSMNLSQIQDIPGDSKRDVVIAGLITSKKNILTKKGDKMCFAQLEDLNGKIECIVFPRVFAENEQILSETDPVVMTGQVNLAEHPRKFFPQKIEKLKKEAETRVSGVRINIDVNTSSEVRLKRMREVILSYKGSVPCHLILETSEGKARMPLGEGFQNPVPQFAAKINEIFNQNSVKFIVDGSLQEGVTQ